VTNTEWLTTYYNWGRVFAHKVLRLQGHKRWEAILERGLTLVKANQVAQDRGFKEQILTAFINGTVRTFGELEKEEV